MDCGGATVYERDARLKASVAFEYMEIMKYDAMNLGTNEMLLGVDFVKQELKPAERPFLSSNMHIENARNGVVDHIVKTVGDLKVGIVGIMSDHALEFDESKTGLRIATPETALSKLIPEVRKEADVIILLSAMSFAETESVLENMKMDRGIDLVIACDYDSETSRKHAGETPVLLSGSKGTTLGHARVVYDPASKRISLQNQEAIALEQDIPDNEAIIRMVDQKVVEYEKDVRLHAEKVHEALAAGLKLTPQEFMKQYSRMARNEEGTIILRKDCD